VEYQTTARVKGYILRKSCHTLHSVGPSFSKAQLTIIHLENETVGWIDRLLPSIFPSHAQYLITTLVVIWLPRQRISTHIIFIQHKYNTWCPSVAVYSAVHILFDVRSAKIQYIIHVNVRERNTQISINVCGGVLGGREKYTYMWILYFLQADTPWVYRTDMEKKLGKRSTPAWSLRWILI